MKATYQQSDNMLIAYNILTMLTNFIFITLECKQCTQYRVEKRKRMFFI